MIRRLSDEYAEQFNGCIMLLMNIGTQANVKARAGDNAYVDGIW